VGAITGLIRSTAADELERAADVAHQLDVVIGGPVRGDHNARRGTAGILVESHALADETLAMLVPFAAGPVTLLVVTDRKRTRPATTTTSRCGSRIDQCGVSVRQDWTPRISSEPSATRSIDAYTCCAPWAGNSIGLQASLRVLTCSHRVARTHQR
jgi:hypothetical protein